jgi:hypothetical protein
MRLECGRESARQPARPLLSPTTRPQPQEFTGVWLYDHNFCGGSEITSPETDVCATFDCIDPFWDGDGYMIECERDAASPRG